MAKKNYRADEGVSITLNYTNDEGYDIRIPFIRAKGEKKFKPCGIFLKKGLSKSDPNWESVHPLPHDWEPGPEMKAAMKKALSK